VPAPFPAKPSAYQPLYHPAPESRLEQLAERVTVFVAPTATIGMHIAIPDKMWFSDHPYFPKTLERATPMAFRKGDRAASGPDRQWLRPAIFRRGPRPLSTAKQNRRPSHSFGPSLRCGCRSVPPAAFVAMKAAIGAADPTRKSRDDRRPR
jgi:hypothetical protein